MANNLSVLLYKFDLPTALPTTKMANSSNFPLTISIMPRLTACVLILSLHFLSDFVISSLRNSMTNSPQVEFTNLASTHPENVQ
ncbi:hypothetical protein HMI54_005624 [Coelomomyces lativittatus]|nr:hypothetical protein HMI54_005624 [Coelomomyces lativittatus]